MGLVIIARTALGPGGPGPHDAVADPDLGPSRPALATLDAESRLRTERLCEIRGTPANLSGSAPKSGPAKVSGMPAIIGRTVPSGDRHANVSGGALITRGG